MFLPPPLLNNLVILVLSLGNFGPKFHKAHKNPSCEKSFERGLQTGVLLTRALCEKPEPVKKESQPYDEPITSGSDRYSRQWVGVPSFLKDEHYVNDKDFIDDFLLVNSNK